MQIECADTQWVLKECQPLLSHALFFYSTFQFTESFDDQNLIYPNIPLGSGGCTMITIPLEKGDKSCEWFIWLAQGHTAYVQALSLKHELLPHILSASWI